MATAAPDRCPVCAAPAAAGARFCASCGAVLGADETPTGTAPRPRTPTPAGPRSGSTGGSPAPTPVDRHRSSGPSVSGRRSALAATQGRFAPGELVLERYRIVGRVGGGGMGEVYRADDLKLDQPVALKFLPVAVLQDPERLERLFGEVRVARQVSHPAVCRVYDIGEHQGEHFLSMEYVDGENLASLLKRIGRLPGDKALDIARQISAGLKAAHDKSVLHRDLKPENVMLDSQGNVRITDFGLAGLADEIQGDDVRSGTPAYMSPEQLAGREVTVRSDVYALGLVLYELFTGRRPFTGRTLAELRRQHETETPERPSGLVEDIDPAVETAILKCLEKDPRRRPPSALLVSALLPGGDPLAAALAAGETPSPEMVAAAVSGRSLRPLTAAVCLAVSIAAALAAPAWVGSRSLLGRVPAAKAPAVLEDRARTLLRDLGAAGAAEDAKGFLVDAEYVLHTIAHDPSPTRWAGLATGEPPVLQFWFRQSPQPLVSMHRSTRVTVRNPPIVVSGMAGVRLDTRGLLTGFYRVPPQEESESPPATGRTPAWARVFEEAGLDLQRFKPVASAWTPPFYCDGRSAWEGVYPQRPEIKIRVETAEYRGEPIWFEVVAPWTRAERMRPFQFSTQQLVGQAIATAILLALIAAGGVLARRHLLLGRGDRRGSFRLAAFAATVGILIWALQCDHVRDRSEELGLAMRGVGQALLFTFILWMFYMALEPYVRKLRPEMLISWARLLAGHVRDPLVGRDALVGTAWGTLVVLFLGAEDRLPALLGHPDQRPVFGDLDAVLGLRRTLAVVLRDQLGSMLLGMAILLVFVLLFLLLRRTWPTVIVLIPLLVAIVALESDDSWWLAVPAAFVIFGSLTAVLLRFGLLAVIAGLYVLNLLNELPLVQDPTHWASTPTIVAMLLISGLALFGFRTQAPLAQAQASE
jgi:serine/threonine-protein kinase